MFFQDLRTVSFDVPPQEVIDRLNTGIETTRTHKILLERVVSARYKFIDNVLKPIQSLESSPYKDLRGYPVVLSGVVQGLSDSVCGRRGLLSSVQPYHGETSNNINISSLPLVIPF